MTKHTPKVLIADALSPTALEIFKSRGLEVVQQVGLKPEELKNIIADYDGIAIRSATKVTAEILAAAPKLKVVGRAGIGVDNVDVPAATAHGVVVMNTPFGNSTTTAEHALAMMFASARDIPAANASTHAGKWEKNRFMGVELMNKTLGIIGCGNIGSIVADRALGLKMKVIAFDPFLSDARAIELGVEKVSLAQLWPRADFITVHTPLTEDTKNIINAASLAQCKKGVRIINCARGGLIDEDALFDALTTGQVAAAALDVFAIEPAKTHRLFGHEKVICTPHLGASTSEAQENVAIQIAEQMSDFLLKGAVSNALNMAAVSAEDAPRLKPYMDLARQLGALAGQLATGDITALSLEYAGQVAELNIKPLTAIVLAGVLATRLESVNMVNAPHLARERGLAISETRHGDAPDYQTLLRLTLQTSNGPITLAGTLFGGAKPRIVGINGVAVEAELSPHMLYTINEDKPGYIGRLGSTLGQAGVNIATFHLGRTAAGATAVALVAIDQPLSVDVLAQISGLAGVVTARALKFVA